MPKIAIFTDLDGTLLHPKTYSFEDARPALEKVRVRDIPLVLVSSKTRAELEFWRSRLGNRHPFVSENGGGVFVPNGYFGFEMKGKPKRGYWVSSLGTPYNIIRKKFVDLRNGMNVRVKGFGDMSVEEIAALTSLPLNEAALAKQRDFDEPFVFHKDADRRFLEAVETSGLRWTRGRLYHIMGDNDKGRAVRILKGLYEREYGRIATIGLGDALNDLPMLKEVDRPVLIRREDGSFDPEVDLPGLIRTSASGPAGWNESVLQLLER